MLQVRHIDRNMAIKGFDFSCCIECQYATHGDDSIPLRDMGLKNRRIGIDQDRACGECRLVDFLPYRTVMVLYSSTGVLRESCIQGSTIP